MLILARSASILLGSLVLAVALVGILDPEGSQLADDANPFGEANLTLRSIVMLGLALILILWPVVQWVRSGRNRG